MLTTSPVVVLGDFLFIFIYHLREEVSDEMVLILAAPKKDRNVKSYYNIDNYFSIYQWWQRGVTIPYYTP